MRRKRLMTAVLCAILAAASCNVGVISDKSIVYTAKAQTDRYKLSPNLIVSDLEQLTSSNKNISDTEQPTNPSETASDTEQPTDSSETILDTEQPTDPSETIPDTEQPTDPRETIPDTEQPTDSSETIPDTEQPTDPSETEPDTGQPTDPSETESDTEQPTDPSETIPDTEQPTAPEESGESDTEFAGETGMTDESESELLTENQKDQALEKDEKESESETEKESETEQRGSNEELIRKQNIVKPDDIVLEFRFTQVEPEYAIVQLKEGISVYEDRSEAARVIGKLNYYGICSVLEETEDGWYYIESGSVRGFVKAGAFVTDEVAERIVRVKGLENLPLANRLVSCMSNKAYAYKHTTTQEVLAEKVYAIAKEDTKIYEARKKDADIVGSLSEGALCYILADSEKDWIFVESGDARGFVQKEALLKGKKAKKLVQETGEEKLQLAEVTIRPEDNRACYYTLTSVKKASVSAKLREDIVNFALDYLGNPYVWGGTSLTAGADCSGFVQSVYANFGYYLPRVAEAQSVYGMQIPVEAAAPGDLIFYARDGYVYHVSMYIGNGQVVHAAGRKVGIITSGITDNAVWATRIILEE